MLVLRGWLETRADFEEVRVEGKAFSEDCVAVIALSEVEEDLAEGLARSDHGFLLRVGVVLLMFGDMVGVEVKAQAPARSPYWT